MSPPRGPNIGPVGVSLCHSWLALNGRPDGGLRQVLIAYVGTAADRARLFEESRSSSKRATSSTGSRNSSSSGRNPELDGGDDDVHAQALPLSRLLQLRGLAGSTHAQAARVVPEVAVIVLKARLLLSICFSESVTRRVRVAHLNRHRLDSLSQSLWLSDISSLPTL